MERGVRFRAGLHVKKHRIVLNVSGQRFMTEKSRLKRYPHTLLGSDLLACFFDESRQEYFFDRDPYLFRYILNYYHCGKLHASPEDCPIAFKDELDYFGISIHEMEDCCWLTACDKREKNQCHYAVRKTSIKAVHTVPAKPAKYMNWAARKKSVTGANAKETAYNDVRLKSPKKSIIEANAKETVYNDVRLNNPKKTITEANTKETAYRDVRVHITGATKEKHKFTQRKSAHFIELSTSKDNPENDCPDEVVNNNNHHGRCGCKPPNSRLQNAFNFLYGCFIILSVVVTTVETIDCSEGIKCEAMYPITFFAVDTIFVAVFTLEFLIRFFLSRNRCTFMKDPFNVVDLLAILPYYLTLIVSYYVDATDVTVLITLRVLRVSRIMKLTRGSSRLQSFLYTLRNCSTDLVFLYFTFTLGIVLFASVLYYVEKDDNTENFASIPHSLWYTCVTMMTTGYGDVVPLTTLGKLVGGLCCICGVVIMSLPIPIMQDKKVVVLG